MKKRFLVTVAAISAVSLSLAACGGGGGDEPAETTDGSSSVAEETEDFKVVNVLNGPLGDQSFFDDAERGMETLKSEGYDVKSIEGELENPTQWQSNLESVSTGDWDVVITGTTQMHDILDSVAPNYPDQKYIIYDDEVVQPNVASIIYKQNEGSFLAGVLAAQATLDTDAFPNSTGSKIVGMVGGMDLPVIRDFLVGFTAGVHAVDPDIKVLDSFVGDFADSNKGYDQATAMYTQGADVVFQVAGGAGLGVLKAAADANRYAIGVDSNQNGVQEGFILASMLKNIGISLDSAVKATEDGSLKYGETTEYGLANEGVGLDYEGNGDIVPQEVQDLVKSFGDQVVSGELEVPTAF